MRGVSIQRKDELLEKLISELLLRRLIEVLQLVKQLLTAAPTFIVPGRIPAC